MDTHKSFGDARVLNGVNFHLEQGLIYTFKGGNNFDKNIVLKFIYDLLKLCMNAQERKDYFHEQNNNRFVDFNNNTIRNFSNDKRVMELL